MLNTQELFEAAHLDALGLLEPGEQAEFEAALRSAPPAIRAQIREEQARTARPDRVRTSVEPAADLRARVLAAVKADIASVLSSARSRSHGAGRELPTVHPVRRVSPLWRAMALGCATVAVVLSVLVIQQKTQMTNLAVASQNDQTINKFVDFFGQRKLPDALFSPDTKRVAFVPVDRNFKGEVSIWYNSEWNAARFFCRNLNTRANETVRLVAIDDNGNINELASISSDGGFVTQEISLARGFVPRQLAIYVAAKGLKASQGSRVMVAASV
jgi:hypothetical protein